MSDFRIKEICKEKGLTQKELAEKIGISPVGLAKALAGNTTVGTLDKIATALGVSVSELFEEPRKDSTVITCPHCGKPITINAEK
ncbi:MAG: helix-turn-helix transcriptional regulator [Muribaculaceae bacterium]|nr:helix-turn-helix transcriptional regulator [Muribaculaceae bacterium]